METAPHPPVDPYADVARVVLRRRFLEARDAGLTMVEARLFAESTADVGQLRLLVKGGCPPRVIADIIL